MTDDQFRVATAQIIGIAAGSLVDGNPNDSAWVARNVERYNEQLHRETVEKIEQESGRYAQENQISQPEAEKRLAQAAQYYLDADWRTVMLKDGYVPDEAALDYLGEILAPTGSYYAERQTPKGASLEPGRQYTAQETAALLRDFEFNNLGAFSDTSINSENFVGFAQGDLSNNYKRFYERTLKVDSSWSDWSLGNAVGATQRMSASVRGLQNTVSGIANDPVGALEQFANGVGYFAQYPLTTIGNGWDSLVEKGGLSQAYAMQGRHELAGAVAAEQLTDFGIGLIPGERLLALGKVGGATNALDGLVWHDAARGAKETHSKNSNPNSAYTDSEAGISNLPQVGSSKGEPELPPKNASSDMVRSIKRQNEAAMSLAQAGYDVEQLANTGRKGANPDLRIDGELADVASARTRSAGSVLMTINDKVKKQASSVVINLADSPLAID